jgi:hypothetical protein
MGESGDLTTKDIHHYWKIDSDAKILFQAYASTIDGRYLTVGWDDLAEETQEAWRLVTQKAYELYN